MRMDQKKEQAHQYHLEMDQTEQVAVVEAVETVAAVEAAAAAFELMNGHLEEVGSETPLPILKERERERERVDG